MDIDKQKASKGNRVTRHMRSQSTNDLQVIIAAKDLCSYVFIATQKSPKAFRFSLVGKMQNLALEVIENLYRANDVFVTGDRAKELHQDRLDFQHEARTSLRLLGYLATLSYESGCITSKQLEIISKRSFECGNLLKSWIDSDSRRYEERFASSQ